MQKKDLCLKFKLNLALSEQYMRRMPEIKLTYFNIEGKAELIRLLLHAGNFEFEDFRVGNLIKMIQKRKQQKILLENFIKSGEELQDSTS